MKINLEFESVESMVNELPRFAAIINFSGKFARFNSDGCLESPDLPEAEKTDSGVTVHAASAKNKSREEVAAAIDEALDEAEAMGAIQSAENGDGEAKKPEKPQAEEPQIKDTDVRAAFSKLIKAGKRDSVKSILESFGVEYFSQMKPGDYADALAKAKEALSND